MAQGEIKFQSLSFKSPDGLQLQQDVYLPTGSGPFPVVLIRTPYGRYQYKGDGHFFASNGYATVIQDVRGKFDSEGHFTPFLHETEDGLATLDWIAQQDWCDGQIGIYGISYSGFCGLTLSNKKHPNLKSVVNFSGWIKPATMAAPGGANHLMLNLTWLLHEETETSRNILEYDLDSLFYHLPLSEVFTRIGIQSKAWEDPKLLSHVNANFRYEDIQVPVLHLTGAFDFVKEATLEAFVGMKNKGKSSQKLIFGPWFHNQSHTSLTEVGEVDFGPASLYGDDKVRQIALHWLDQHMWKKELRDWPQVRVFLMFDDRWYDFDSWPLEQTQPINFFIGSQHAANSSAGDGSLETKSPKGKDWDQFTYDPSDPVLTNGGANFHFFPGQLGIKDQTELEKRKDVLVYTSETIKDEMAIIGTPKFIFHASSSAPDTDFTAKLILLAPDGTAMNICDGIVRARHRKGMDQVDLLEAGKVYPFEIQLGTTAFKVPAGYKLRLEVSSSNFPKYNRNTNTLEDPFYAKNYATAEQRIYHSEKYPSLLVLPHIPMHQLKDQQIKKQ